MPGVYVSLGIRPPNAHKIDLLDGRLPHMTESIRALKWHLSGVIYRALLVDATQVESSLATTKDS